MQIRQTQQQRLLLAPQVTLSLKVLHMTNIELQPFLQQQVEDNPLLEIDEPADNEPSSDSSPETETSQTSASDNTAPEDDWAQDWPSSAPSLSTAEEDPDRTDRAALEHWTARSLSLQESLKRQLGCLNIDPQERRLGEVLIDRLNEHGYMEDSLAALADELKLKETALVQALEFIHRLEPAGIGARNLRECLMLQLEDTQERQTLAYKILERHFQLFVQNRPFAIAKATRAPMSRVESALLRIRRLNPRPGDSLTGALPQSIVPDMIVVRKEHHYDIELNDQYVPQLSINRSYYRMLRDPSTTPEVREFLQGKFRQAGWVIRAIDERNATLLAIGRCLISMQREFLEGGRQTLKPLTQAQVAGAIGRHPSTVSRAIAGKTIDTPSGIFRLEELFATAVAQTTQAGGRTLSDAHIKSAIQEVVRTEDPTYPLSDSTIVQRLRQRQVSIARRTVAKYRTSLKILPARLRRRRLT